MMYEIKKKKFLMDIVERKIKMKNLKKKKEKR